MAEGCPTRATLEGFAAGSQAEPARAEVEAHLAECLACAEELDGLTRAQLELLVGQPRSAATLRPATHPALDTVMRRAVGSAGSSQRFDPRRVLETLDPPTTAGSLGSFADYDLLEIAGSGGMGVVFRARDRTLDRVVALKVIAPTGGDDDAFAVRFLEEARAVAAIHHEHIVTVHHAGRTKGLAYLVMPFHAAGTLEQRLTRTPKLPPGEVAELGLQLARALIAMHGRGILHRDIKPSNILLEDGLQRVRLADFGLARSPGSAPTALEPGNPGKPGTGVARRTIAGTPHYMSPEQASGESPGVRSDLFGLGAVLYQMATGRTLYAGETSEEVLRAARRCEHPSVRETASDVSAPLAATIDRLLAKRPEDRFASAHEVAFALERCINQGGAPPRRFKRAALGGIAACLVLSGTLAALDWSGQTAVINTLLCQQSGNVCYIRGRFGTFAGLPEAVAAARANDIVETRFSGERLVDPFRVGGKPLTIRAVKGFTPILVATNNGQPMILVDAPLTLEGLTLWRCAPQLRVIPLIMVEEAPLHLLNCRIIRSRFQGQNILVSGRIREVPSDLRYFPLLAFQNGSTGHLRNCLVGGTQATAIGMRASTTQPTRVEGVNNLFVIDRVLLMKPEAETSAELKFSQSVFVTGALVDIDETGPVTGLSVTWEDCLIDRSEGALLRLNHGYEGAFLRALNWRETNVVYAGSGPYAISRRRAIQFDADWSGTLRLNTASHRLLDRQIFPKNCVRSSLALNAADLDEESMRAVNNGSVQFTPEFVGEGQAYAAFRGQPAYGQWQTEIRNRTMEWQSRAAANAAAAR